MQLHLLNVVKYKYKVAEIFKYEYLKIVLKYCTRESVQWHAKVWVPLVKMSIIVNN